MNAQKAFYVTGAVLFVIIIVILLVTRVDFDDNDDIGWTSYLSERIAA